MRFDVAMCDTEMVDGEQSSEDLIGQQFDVECVHAFSAGFSDQTIEISVVKRHNDVEILSTLFNGRVISEHLHHEISSQHAYNLHLSVLVLRILEDLLHCDYLSSFLHSALENLAKSALPNQLDQIDVATVGVSRRGIHSPFSVHPSLHIEISTLALVELLHRHVLFLALECVFLFQLAAFPLVVEDIPLFVFLEVLLNL